MQSTRIRPGTRRGGILSLRVDDIAPDPVQPRRRFDDEALRELSESIRRYGILNPLTVRLRSGRYHLVAGERRLRAAKLAGLREVPCILIDADMQDAALLALIENLQREDMDPLEEAEGLQRVIGMFGLSQEELARRIGKSQSAVANKLRLLKLPGEIREAMRRHGLSERHGRALLRLPDARAQRQVLREILDKDLTVAATEALVERLLAQARAGQPAGEESAAPEKKERRRSFILKDVRVFLNSVSRSVEMMQQGGIGAAMERQETEEALILTISIPKSRTAAEPAATAAPEPSPAMAEAPAVPVTEAAPAAP
ncbi:MAG: ParB/RepB/Spo0J family partition protein [Oscillospiraceae bacterium]|nr:ParB/RepB/Spo0J family partition protein [Oscillospiraceae bacterium]